MDALHEVVIQPITWAISAAFVINFTGLDLSPTVQSISSFGSLTYSILGGTCFQDIGCFA